MTIDDTNFEKLLHNQWNTPCDLTKWHTTIEGYSIDGCVALTESKLIIVLRREEAEEDDTRPEIKLLRIFRDESPQISSTTLVDVKIIGNIIALNDNEVLWVSNIGDVFNLTEDNDLSGFETVIPNKDSEFGYRTIKGINRIGSHVYAAGGWRHIFKRKAKDDWVDITTNLDRSDLIDKDETGWDTGKSNSTGFGCVGGFSENDVYAAGRGGDCWHYNGSDWNRIDLPTIERIYKIIAVEPDKVYMACGRGILLERNENKWTVIKFPDNNASFTQMVLFKNTIYISTEFLMYKLVNGTLEKCLPSSQNTEIELFCHHYLSANDHIMLMCGQASAAIFDGDSWWPLIPNGPITAETSDSEE